MTPAGSGRLLPLRDPVPANILTDMLCASDPGAVMLAAAALDHALRRALAVRLGEDEELVNDLADRGNPLSSLKARADLAFAFKLLGPLLYRDVNSIACVIGVFASRPSLVSFDHAGVRNLVGEISCVAHWRQDHVDLGGNKGEFAYAVRACCALIVQDMTCIC